MKQTAAQNPQSDVRTCRACGCTDDDCRQCIARTGRPCSWVEQDLCSACAEGGFNTLIRVKRGNENIASARVGNKTYRCSCTSSEGHATLHLAEKIRVAVRAKTATVARYRTLSMEAAMAALYLEFQA
jgi:hypothetical protein